MLVQQVKKVTIITGSRWLGEIMRKSARNIKGENWNNLYQFFYFWMQKIQLNTHVYVFRVTLQISCISTFCCSFRYFSYKSVWAVSPAQLQYKLYCISPELEPSFTNSSQILFSWIFSPIFYITPETLSSHFLCLGSLSSIYGRPLLPGCG